MPVAKFTISADGADVTSRLLGAGLMNMTVVDGEGLKADTLQISIDNVDGSVIAPRTGVVLRATGGYEGMMRYFGAYTVDSVVYTGWPQRIDIDAKSVAAKSLAKQREPKAYDPEDYPTYGDIFESVAGRIGLTLRMDGSLKGISNSYEAQTDENALEFVTRMGARLGASVSAKDGNLVVVKKGAGTAASGAALDTIPVMPGLNMLSYSVTKKDEPKHDEVEAPYYDRDKNTLEVETVQTGMGGPKFRMRFPSQDKDEAKRMAEAQANELQMMVGDASFEIDGTPFAQAGAWAVVSGVNSEVNGRWRVITVTHNFSATGAYSTTLACGTTSGEGGQE